MLQSNIINVILAEDGIIFFCQVAAKICAFFVELWTTASNWWRHIKTLTFDLWGHCACQ